MMPPDWMTNRVDAGHKIADRLANDQNPVLAAVELGSAAGSLVAKIFEARGGAGAHDFLVAFVAVFNQETLRVDQSQKTLHLTSS